MFFFFDTGGTSCLIKRTLFFFFDTGGTSCLIKRTQKKRRKLDGTFFFFFERCQAPVPYQSLENNLQQFVFRKNHDLSSNLAGRKWFATAGLVLVVHSPHPFAKDFSELRQFRSDKNKMRLAVEAVVEGLEALLLFAKGTQVPVRVQIIRFGGRNDEEWMFPMLPAPQALDDTLLSSLTARLRAQAETYLDNTYGLTLLETLAAQMDQQAAAAEQAAQMDQQAAAAEQGLPS
ncbi:hypothetical protein PAPYR_10731 [Paratrimastix pyriformis]|uniref:Uncharacterized protein n=1 Tax=Paratrimastix pyriformis TaxID=342808 RepID=A0ABQ8UCJ3_9EUKA|nr:hypothetical protein PAPYR_10731 [Paratrimastix pyriformis]